LAVFSVTALLTTDASSTLYDYREAILAGASFFSLLLILGAGVPTYLRSQEQLVLTEEALLQVLQPTLFSSKVDQLSLQHVTDVSVHQDFFGTMLGYGQITIETPGEQNNYKFFAVASPQEAARAISAAHENFDAALQSGRLHTSLGTSMPQAPQIDPQEYQEFLQFQQMRNAQQQGQAQQPSSSQVQDGQNSSGSSRSGQNQ
jgi:uncharacterized membrane protein YdbT with pleckstrin-like domain